MKNFWVHLKNKNFFSLWLAQIISQFGDRVNQMALIGLIAERSPGSAWGLAKLMSFTIIPVFIVGPIAGVFVDRWDRRTTLIVCDFLRGALVLTIPLIFIYRDSMVPIYSIVFLIFCLSRFYVPAKMSIIPDLVQKDGLLAANSLVSLTGMIAFVLGCSLGGYIVEKQGYRNGFLCDSATYFISGTLIFLISNHKKMNLHFRGGYLISTGREIVSVFRKSVLQEAKEGILYLFKKKEIRLVMVMLFVLFAAAGAIYVVIIVFIQESFKSITSHLAILAIFLGVGLFVGAVLYGRFGEKISRVKTIFTCLMSGGIVLVIFALIVQERQSMFWASVMSITIGIIVGPIIIATNTIAHIVSDEQMRGKVFSGLEIVIHLAFLSAMLISSFLSEHLQRFWILTGVGLMISLVGILGLIKFGKRRDLLEIKGENL